MKHTKTPWKIAYSDGSGPEYITTDTGDDTENAIVTIRWGCGCCKNDPKRFDDLTAEEQATMKFIALAANYHDRLVEAVKNSLCVDTDDPIAHDETIGPFMVIRMSDWEKLTALLAEIEQASHDR